MRVLSTRPRLGPTRTNRQRENPVSDTPITVIDIRVNGRDGWFYAFSTDMPELHVCGTDRKAVLRDVCPIIKKLYKLNYNLDVEVRVAAKPNLAPVRQPTLKDHFVRLLAFEVPELQPA
jgi:hypothetical protein